MYECRTTPQSSDDASPKAVPGVSNTWSSEPLSEELRKMHDFHTVTAPHPFQIALANALSLPESFYDKLRAEYLARKTILCDAVNAMGMTYYEPGGSYFLWCEYSRISPEDDTVFYERLLREWGVARSRDGFTRSRRATRSACA